MKHVQVRLEDGEFAEFKKKAQVAGFDSVQAAGRQAMLLVDWAGEGPGVVPAKYRPYMDALAELLASGETDLIEIFARPLEFARNEVRRRRASGGSKKGGQ